MTIPDFRLLLLMSSCLAIISSTYCRRCKYGKSYSGKVTYHNYTQTTSMNDVACQLPMVFRRGRNFVNTSKIMANKETSELRVTAVHRRHKKANNIMCGDCINVRNIDSGKSIVVMIIDFADDTELDLCPEAFAAIDNVDRNGYNQGFMNVLWYKTSCEDLIGNEPIRYRFKSGSSKNWFMGVTITSRTIPLSRTKAVQISNHQSDPLSWFTCKDNGAIGYWFCTGHKPYSMNDPFYFKITSIDGQVLVDTIDIIGESDEGNFIKSFNNLQFKGCKENNETSISSTQSIGESSIVSSWLCVLKQCDNCLWEYPNGISCYKDWTKSQCVILEEYGFHWCGDF